MEDFYNNALENLLHEDRIPFRREKGEAWSMVKSRIESSRQTPVYQLRSRFQGLKIAAGVAILLGAIAFFVSMAGTQKFEGQAFAKTEIVLPDGSKIYLKGESNASYNQWLWSFDREVRLEGEAFFQVEKGSSFEVLGDLGAVEVLGTSFSVNTDAKNFDVACKTGAVKVTSRGGSSISLKPGQRVRSANGELVLEEIRIEEIAYWVEEDYIFENVPAKELFDTLAKVTGYTFIIDAELNMHYSGQFEKNQPIEEILSIVCQPMNLNFELSEDTITITKK